jgi:hypothetical protein
VIARMTTMRPAPPTRPGGDRGRFPRDTCILGVLGEPMQPVSFVHFAAKKGFPGIGRLIHLLRAERAKDVAPCPAPDI